ncbi:N-acyl-D-glucosamine 2-epimerase [Pedobacter sp. HMF7647]|uniref:Cellobiose 2-epimerase n=1 Tax=Hufsiella arboris TaxID=2695275 RepID=A0A7K1Y6L1_9SPHI|nr:AGE family epimerase/isomerase [Hufsiella arboris]MXV50203.1 N-acyl-D-glucosamine 2-epimerase [Hufsiella arboris]
MSENFAANVSYLKDEFSSELKNILRYWIDNTVDEENGGFYGQIDENNQVIDDAPKGSVLNARILWSFSAAYNLTSNYEYLLFARRSADYFLKNFVDKLYGGVYWSIKANGDPLDAKKQIYALAFAIYGLTEYYKADRNEAVLDTAIELYQTIEKYSFDNERGGYFEAFTRDWRLIDDLRLSEKDANEKKTMNTHLHILEAYTNLFRVWPDLSLKIKIVELLKVFGKHIFNEDYHLNLFFDENWSIKSDIISYGHDIEASWLLLEAAEVLEDEVIIQNFQELSINVAEAAAEGLDKDGSMFYEMDFGSKHLIQEKHWWVQAEAIVGFLNASQISNDDKFFSRFLKVWQFTRNYIIDHKHGEWLWGILPDHSTMPCQDKVGIWKCPYHNSRACIEVIKRLG